MFKLPGMNAPMRVAIVSETYPPEVNGVALTVQSLCTGLRVRGHQVQLIRPCRADEAPAHAADTWCLPSWPLPRYPGLRVGRPARKRLQDAWTQRRPDAVYVATEGPLGWSALSAARALAVPVCSGFHTRFDHYMASYGLGLLSGAVFAGLRRFHNRADATLVPTESLRSELRARGMRHVRLLRRAVDTRQFHPAYRDPALRARWGVDEDTPVLMHVGRIAAEKNLDLLLRTYAAVRADCPRARLVMVGDGPEQARLRARHPDLVFCGVQRGEALARHFASGDLFVFPSLSETFGNVTLEAMASGLATIAFAYGAAGEHLHHGEHGALVGLRDESGFIAHARALAKDLPLARTLGAAARMASTQWQPERVSAEFESILRTLGDAPGAAPPLCLHESLR